MIFFPLLAVLYWITPTKYRWLTLLILSYFFYVNIKPVYALLMAGVTLSTYIFTRLIDKTKIEKQKKMFMVVNIVVILLPLFFYKYFGTINNELFRLLEFNNLRWPFPPIKLILPIGISFYTFMAIGYTVDVYNEEIEAEKNIGILALFVSFFPLILSGPIERAKNMLPQFKAPKKINYSAITLGLKFILWGYFMKLVVADRLGIYVDTIYRNIPKHNGTSLLLASALYPFQVYTDLGGYSLIAIGTAKILGFNVMQNFKRPFFATTMSEFWRRWHISLISWLTDYVYTPLSFAFRQYKIWGIVIALMVTFLISGLWHGAALTFIIWGFMQGIFLSLEAVTSKQRISFEKRFKLQEKVWYTFLTCLIVFILFASSQIFARASSFQNALLIYQKIFTARGPLFFDMTTLSYSLVGLGILFFKDIRDEYFPGKFLFFENKNIVIRYGSYLIIVFLILLLGVLDNSQFIYFQF